MKHKRINLRRIALNGLSGISGLTGLGDMMPHTKAKIEGNKRFFENMLNCPCSLKGESDKMSFKEVLEKYNKGLSENDIKAWVYYKLKQGLPMTEWKNHVKVTDNDIPGLIASGAMFICGDEYQPLPVYAYGNMYEKADQLIKDKDRIVKTYGKAVYEKHLEVIENNKPKQLKINDPEQSERPVIQVISKFAREESIFSIKTVRAEYLSVEKAEQLTYKAGRLVVKKNSSSSKYKPINLAFDGIKEYSLRDVFIKYLITLDRSEFKKTNATEITEYYIYANPIRDDNMTESEKQEIKSSARDEGEMLFARFLFDVLTPEDQDRLNDTWNRLNNAYSDIKHNLVPVGFEISRKFKSGNLELTPIQREGVAWYNLNGSGICAFDVGVGKTMTAIVAIANALYSGQCSRPLIVVPKPTYRKWINEIIGYDDPKTGKFVAGVLSHTKIKVNGLANLGVGVKADYNKKVQPFTITVVTYEGFKKMGFSDDISDSMITELINVLQQSKSEDKSQRDKEIEYKKYEKIIGVGQKDTVAEFDKLGFDYICIDEAHRCKNVFDSVKADEENNKRYSMTGSQSVTGIKAFFICNYIQRNFGRNVNLLTATPFTNSPIEIYSMLSLVAYQELLNKNIYNINAFFDMFIAPTKEWSADYKGNIVEKEVIKSFINRMILQKIIHNHIIYRTGSEANVKRPVKVNLPRIYEMKPDGSIQKLESRNQVLTYITPTTKQEMNQARIYAKAKGATTGKLDMRALFQALNESLDNALSPYLYDGTPENYKEFVEESPKIYFTCECIRTVKEWHEKQTTGSDIIKSVSGQVIYANRGKRFFPMIKEYLEKETGYKKNVTMEWEEDGKKRRMYFDEVEIIESEMTEDRKENVKEAFLQGIVKVLIGTATIREGIDLQKRGTVLYDLYPEWNPTDIQQLEGRIYRQGNQFGFVRVVLPLVQNTMDVFVFQKLEEKTSRINDIWYRADRGNVLPVESLDPQELKLALITDIGQIAKIYFETEKQEIKREYERAERSLKSIDNINNSIKSYRESRTKAIKFISNDYKNKLQSMPELLDENGYVATKIDAYPYYYQRGEELEKSKAELRADYKKEHKKFVELNQKLMLWIDNTEKTDPEIIEWSRNLSKNVGYVSGDYEIRYFKEYMTEAYKIERTILKPKKLTLNDDLSGLKAEYEKELAEKKAILDQYEGNERSDRFNEIMNDVRKRKQKLNIDGKEPEERATEFGKLNYLLQYLADDWDIQCGFPKPTDKPGACATNQRTEDDKQRRLRIARVKAAAKLKMLKLMQL